MYKGSMIYVSPNSSNANNVFNVNNNANVNNFNANNGVGARPELYLFCYFKDKSLKSIIIKDKYYPRYLYLNIRLYMRKSMLLNSINIVFDKHIH